jgi:hypothetical protein
MKGSGVLICGIGGGLDIVNALPLYHAIKSKGGKAVLGSVRSYPIKFSSSNDFVNHSGAWIYPDSKIKYMEKPRFAEQEVARDINQEVLYLVNPGKLDGRDFRQSLEKVKKEKGLGNIIFVDSGGDSLILRKEDAGGTASRSSFADPFSGSDSHVLAALSGMSNVYLGIISSGLDISEDSFEKNLRLLNQRGAYYGSVNLHTGEKNDYQLDEVIRFGGNYLDDYFRFVEKSIVIGDEHVFEPRRKVSHTAPVTYHALKGNYGPRETFAIWAPLMENGKRGVEVKPRHSWMHFFDASKIHGIKKELNDNERV